MKKPTDFSRILASYLTAYLRHTKAMHLLEAGVNLFYIKDFLGHEDISTTEVYAKASIETQRAALDDDGISEGIFGKVDWIVKEFTDLAFTFMTSFLYYLDYDSIDEDTRNLYRQGISAFGGITPTYRIALETADRLG